MRSPSSQHVGTVSGDAPAGVSSLVPSTLAERARQAPSQNHHSRAATSHGREHASTRTRHDARSTHAADHHDNANATTVITQEQIDREETMRNWQKQWKKVLSTSVFYFDAIEEPTKEKAKKQLMQHGAEIETFFHGDVSHVITNRSLNVQYPTTDIIYQAKQRSMKLWTYEKLLRFLSYLIESPHGSASVVAPAHAQARHVVASDASNNLTRMLREEKLNGPADSDPRARREDIHYFKGPYIYIRDASQVYKPIMVREYARAANSTQGSWPQFRLTGPGKCPFVIDPSMLKGGEEAKQRPSTNNSLKRAAAQNEKEVTSKGKTKARKVVVYEDEDDSDDNADDDDDDVLDPRLDTPTTSKSNKKSILTPVRTTSARANSMTEIGLLDKRSMLSTKKNYHAKMMAVLGHDVVASGLNMSNVTSNVRSMMQSGSQTHGGNGLAGQTSLTQSKAVTSLKKKVFQSKAKPMPAPPTSIKKDAVAVKDIRPGYCENCKDKYDDYDDHIKSRKHRKFASNGDNFLEVDELLALLVQPIRREAAVDLISPSST
ncbi:Dfp1/Him1, central region-domain-containing protein [Limtongia smithiae]|uniref:Dfp1/Him1, central region-domain-containing protein n=1 Tax=Limtongia smithiae TaxID=1125753 RepID=UPI0034CF075A